MRLAVATSSVCAVLGACTELPDRVGELAPCAEISQAEYEGLRGSASWRTVDLRGGGYGAEASGQTRQRCWPRVQGMNSEHRRCVQTNDLVIEMQTGDATSYFRVPARTTYMTYGEAGQAVCRIVVQEH